MNNIDIFFEAVCLVESNNTDIAVRFEENFYKKIDINDIACKRLRQHYLAHDNKFISNDTVKALLSFSVGRIQIMGYNIFRIDTIYRFFTDKYFYAIPMMIKKEDERVIFELFIRSIGMHTKIMQANTKFLHMNDDLLAEFSKRYNGSVNYMLRLKPAISKVLAT